MTIITVAEDLITVNVELRAFQKAAPLTELKIRPVNIPTAEWHAMAEDGADDATVMRRQLELVFYWGQNDFQPVAGCYSVSVGDIVVLPSGERWRVAGTGFEREPAS